ncbi:MAG: Rrf2 family transcriptional regulator [Patescibacteria group bacterium]|nr:Rrf2 family transcriptional regulator [Patescibacteria group bacterium]
MLKFNSQIRYGLRAIIFLAKQKNQLPISKISKAENIPADFLEKIMLNLKNAGIVKSIRGKKGGFQLAIKPSKINLKIVFEALDEKINTAPCQGYCAQKNFCKAKTVWQKIDQNFKKSLKNINLYQLIK